MGYLGTVSELAKRFNNLGLSSQSQGLFEATLQVCHSIQVVNGNESIQVFAQDDINLIPDLLLDVGMTSKQKEGHTTCRSHCIKATNDESVHIIVNGGIRGRAVCSVHHIQEVICVGKTSLEAEERIC